MYMWIDTLCNGLNFSFVGFTIAPGNNWVLEVGREYEITVHIFDKINHRVIVTEVKYYRVCSIAA